jgi:hypothetical protein
MVEQEGTVGSLVDVTPTADGELPCPACGHVGALVDGACADCGLQLE